MTAAEPPRGNHYEVPATAEELALLDELRAACQARDAAQDRVDALVLRVQRLQRTRLHQMTDL